MRNNKYEIILGSSAKLISQKGYKTVSLQEIANKVGLHKSTLFHYFKNKEKLLRCILEKSVDQVNVTLQQIIQNRELTPEEKLREAIGNHLTLLIEHFDNVNIYLNELRSLSKKNQVRYLQKRRRYEKDFEKIVVEMKKNGYFHGLNTKIVTYGILGMLNWVAKWYRSDGPLSIQEVTNIFYRMLSPQ